MDKLHVGLTLLLCAGMFRVDIEHRTMNAQLRPKIFSTPLRPESWFGSKISTSSL